MYCESANSGEREHTVLTDAFGLYAAPREVEEAGTRRRADDVKSFLALEMHHPIHLTNTAQQHCYACHGKCLFS